MGILHWLFSSPRRDEHRRKPVFSAGELLIEFEPWKATAWVPMTTSGPSAADASKFSGVAFIPKGDAWPECPECNGPMQLFVQLNPKDLPEIMASRLADRMLQFFYCTQCEDWTPFSPSHVTRLIPLDGEPAVLRSPVADSFPPLTITGWEEKADFPSWEEPEVPDGASEDGDKLEALYDLGYPLSGEKLGGWPMWVQAAEYPDCPQCGTQMVLLFQIDSEKNLPHMFGDCGCGHITQCPEHLDVLAFGWACS